MALTAAAGPLSNILQGIIAIVLLFLGMKLFFLNSEVAVFKSFQIDYGTYEGAYTLLYYIIVSSSFSIGTRIVAVLLYMLFIYAALNFVLAVFNLIPIPPFDGSRIAFVLLPDKIYFGVMKYERIIMIVFLVIFFVGGRFGWFDWLFGGVVGLFFKAFSWIL